tara:strand:- start:683 stop:889 length:207 start_codon:yes stop_codon:yes gene_type:complete
MKARAIAIIDFEFKNGFIEAAEEQKKLEAAIENLVKDTSSVVYHEVDMRERRSSDRTPNLKKMKIRLS